MKNLLLHVFVFYLWMGMLQAQELGMDIPPIGTETPSSDYLNQQWYIGKRQEIFEISQNRLEKDDQDLSSLLIQYSFAMEMMNKELILSVMPRIKLLAQKMPEDSALRKEIISDVEWLEPVVAATPQEKIDSRRNKPFVYGKELNTVQHLRSLELKSQLKELTDKEKF